MRYFTEVAYEGTPWHGWQSQKNAPTVQEEIETRLSTFLRQRTPIIGSGRTDTGVHCKQQYFHFDCDEVLKKETFIYRMNSFLPGTIALNNIFRVKDNAHARFDALSRTYKYYIIRNKNPFWRDRALNYYREINLERMQEGAKLLLGEKDFQCFSKVKTDVNTFVCNIFEAHWVEEEGILIFTIKANRFLRGMVRAVVGTLLEIGEGKRRPESIKDLIESRDRKKAGSAADACGLYLCEVNYPESIKL